MRKLYFMLLAMGLFFGLSACSEDKTETPAPTPNPTIQIDETEVVIPALGATVWVNYEITNPIEGESLSYEAAADCWATVDLSAAGAIKFTAPKNETGEERTAELVFNYKNAEAVTVSVSQPAWEAPITLTLNAVEATKVNFTVTTTDPKLTWIPLVTTTEYFDSFESFDEVVEDDMAYIAWAAQDAGMTLAEFLPTLLKTGTMEGLAFKSLMPETEYTLYVYGVTGEGVRTTDIFTAEFTTEPPYDGPITFDIQVSEENYIMDITITPSDESVSYYWNIMDEATYEEWGGSMPEAATALIEYDIEDYLYWGDIYDRSEYYEWFTTLGATNSQFECLANTKYIIYAAKWNENCEIEGEVATYWHTTATVEPSDNQITLEVSNPTATTFDVNTTTTNNDPYVVLAEPSEWCGWDEMTDDEIHAYVMAYYGTWYITDYICEGPVTDARFTGLDTETEYSVIAYGYEAGARTTEVVRTSISTLAGGDPADCTFEFEVIEVGSNYAYVGITPSDNSHYYYWMVFEASATAEEVKENIEMVIDEWYYGDMWEFAYYELVQGSSDGEVTMLSPETEYKVAAVIMDDETGEYLSEVHFSDTFTTTEMVYADIEVSCGFDAYYDGDLLAAASEEYAIYAGYAMVPLKIELEGEYGEYYYTMFQYMEGLEDPELYPDHMLYNSLYEGVSYATEMNFRAPWDTPVMIAAMALDYYGNYSPIYRQVVTFTKEGASPIDELIGATRSMVLKHESIDTFKAPASKRTFAKQAKKQTSNRFNSEVINQAKSANHQKVEAEKREQKRAELQLRKAQSRIRIAE